MLHAHSDTLECTDSVQTDDRPLHALIKDSEKNGTLDCHHHMVSEPLIAFVTARSCASEAQTNRSGQLSWKTGALAVECWQEPRVDLRCLCPSSRQKLEEEYTVQDLCSASRRRKTSGTPSTSISRLQNHDERSCQNTAAVDQRLCGTQWLAHGHVSQLSGQPIVANIVTVKLEHGKATLEELVGQLLLHWHRAMLDAAAAGLFVLTGERLR